jgi:hypothetical protein
VRVDLRSPFPIFLLGRSLAPISPVFLTVAAFAISFPVFLTAAALAVHVFPVYLGNLLGFGVTSGRQQGRICSSAVTRKWGRGNKHGGENRKWVGRE